MCLARMSIRNAHVVTCKSCDQLGQDRSLLTDRQKRPDLMKLAITLPRTQRSLPALRLSLPYSANSRIAARNRDPYRTAPSRRASPRCSRIAARRSREPTRVVTKPSKSFPRGQLGYGHHRNKPIDVVQGIRLRPCTRPYRDRRENGGGQRLTDHWGGSHEPWVVSPRRS